MNRKFISLLAASAALLASAAPVSLSQAQAVARDFVSRPGMRHAPGGGTLTLAHEAKAASGLTDYYVFNADGGGFIVVSGDDQALPVLGYSDAGAFDAGKLPDNVRWWLGEYQREMEWLRQNPQVTPRQPITLTTSVSPLLTTQWGQGQPYNNYCPASDYGNADDNAYYGGHAVTGCVATATAQIMKYYNWPPTGTGSHSYTCDVGGGTTQTLSANFGQTTYDWTNMASRYGLDDQNNVYAATLTGSWKLATDVQKSSVATLMSHVGISVDMGYGNSSSAYSSDVPNAMKSYFRYDNKAGFFYRQNNENGWDGYLRDEIDAGRPVLYIGEGDRGGHAFIFDGYNNEGYFHVNWGWNSYLDGYFASSALNPGEDSFNYNQAAVIRLAPAKLLLNTNITPTSSTMPMNNVTATARVTANGAAYSGELLAWIVDNDNKTLAHGNAQINAAANQTVTVNFTMSFNGTVGSTYYLRIGNPNMPANGTGSWYYWSDAVAFTAGGGNVLVTNVSVSPTSTTLNVGQTTTLSANVSPSNATNKSVTWTSSNTSVATVSSTGLVTAKAAGTATITATAQDGSGKKGTCTVTVTQPVTSISISPSSSSLNVGQTATLTATVLPSNATNKAVTWTSSSTSVATVSYNGTSCTVTAKAAGTATITCAAQDGSGKTATCTVTVYENVQDHSVVYLRPKGTMYCNWDKNGSGFIMPFVNTKPYDTVTWRNVSSTQGTPTWNYPLWNISTGQRESHVSNDRHLTVTYGYEYEDVPTLTMGSAGSYTLSGYRVNRETGAIENSAISGVAAVPNSEEIYSDFNTNLLCSAHYYGSSNRFGTEKYGWTYYNTNKLYDDGTGYLLGKNNKGWNAFGAGFDKPVSPYLLNKVYLWCTNLSVTKNVNLACRVYRVGDELPAYQQNGSAQISGNDLTLIASGTTTITTAMNDDGSPILEFTLNEPTLVIDDAIVVVIQGMDQDGIQSISGLVTTDKEDEGVGELAYIGHFSNGQLTDLTGLNNLLGPQMKVGTSILLDVTRPFITFNYTFEDGEYTFPASGGTMTQNVGSQTYNGIDFFAYSPKADWTVTNADGGSVPDWLTITLTDEMENGEWTGVVQTNVTAAALPSNASRRDATVRFAFKGASIDYHFVQERELDSYDVNVDGHVDVNDVNAVINLILERTTAFATTADVNADGEVNILDVNAIIDCILVHPQQVSKKPENVRAHNPWPHRNLAVELSTQAGSQRLELSRNLSIQAPQNLKINENNHEQE